MISLSGVGSVEWLIYGFSGLAIVVCLGVIARAVLIPSDVRRMCCCGACGYAITDTAPGRCPECGGSLTKVGISTPAMAIRMRGGLGWAVLAWTVVCGVLAQIGWGYVQAAAWSAMAMASSAASLSSPVQQNRTCKFTPQRVGFSGRNSTQGPEDLDFRIEAVMSYTSGGSPTGTATITVHQNGTAAHASPELDLGARTFELKDGKDASVKKGKASEIDAALIKQWFETADVGTAGAASATSRADCKKLIVSCLDDPDGVESLFQGGFSGGIGSLSYNGGSSSSGPAGGFSSVGFMPGAPDYWTARTKLIAGVLGLVYVAGIVGLWWRRRSLLA